MKNIDQHSHLSLFILVVSLMFSSVLKAQSPAVGTLIQNQATATYKDAAGIEQTATSNLVETLIQQVASMDLVQTQEKIGAIGKQVYFPHVLTNTGNGIDSFDLSAINSGGDSYDFSNLKIYVDANRDGLPDSVTEISSSGSLAAQEEFYFVVAAELPEAGIAAGDLGKTDISATSIFDNSLSETNIDTVIVSDKAIVHVTKAMSANMGASPSGTHTVTLSYINDGLSTATSVTLTDSLPAGMSYVQGSAQWTVRGNSLSLSDANDGNEASQGSSDIQYQGDSASDEVSAVISTLDAGAKGTLSFEVEIDGQLPASTLYNTAEFNYNDGSILIPNAPTNRVPFEIQAQPAVIANGSTTSNAIDADNTNTANDSYTVATATLGSTVSFNNYIRNTGNSIDTFDISIDLSSSRFPAGTVFSLYQEDGFTPLMDTNANGVVDTGPLDPAGSATEYYKVVMKAVLPVALPNGMNNTNNGAGFAVTKSATSSIDSAITDTVTDRLDKITGESVDLTNNSAGSSAPGAGAGPEANPVTIETVSAGEKAVFKLYINNTSAMDSSYQLQASMQNPFVAGSLMTGWKANFYQDGGAADCSTLGRVTSSTGVIPALSNKLICAVVTPPANAVATVDAGGNPIPHSIYFRIISSLTGVSDIKHDAIIIDDSPALSMEPDQSGQVLPGSFIVYNHLVSNNGNTALECIRVDAIDSQNSWTSIVYQDVNEDGLLNTGDIRLTDQVLASGESFHVLVKIFAPASAPMGTSNTTTLTVTANQDDGDGDSTTCTGAALTDKAIDVTRANESDVSIIKKQAADSNCDGVAEGTFQTSTFPVDPDSCVIYQITATNTGAKPVNNVHIDDAAPTFTQFYSAGAIPNVTTGLITGGAAGTDGNISGGSVSGTEITLASGESMVLIFGVRLE